MKAFVHYKRNCKRIPAFANKFDKSSL